MKAVANRDVTRANPIEHRQRCGFSIELDQSVDPPKIPQEGRIISGEPLKAGKGQSRLGFAERFRAGGEAHAAADTVRARSRVHHAPLVDCRKTETDRSTASTRRAHHAAATAASVPLQADSASRP